MAVRITNFSQFFAGLSTDTKPTPAATDGSPLFYEIDNEDWYIWDPTTGGGQWTIFFGPPSATETEQGA